MVRRRVGALIALVVLVSQFQAANAAPRVDATLRLNKPAFWSAAGKVPFRTPADWGVAESAAVFETANPLGNYKYRYDFLLRVAPGGSRLRVAWDRPTIFVAFEMELIGPAGQYAQGYGNYSSELVVDAPYDGIWLARIRTNTDRRDFRMRGLLEGARARSKASTPLLPNLQLVPPYEFTFAHGRGVARFDGQRMVAGPDGVANCREDEILEHNARKCLRFSLGPANVGSGPLQLRFDGAANAGGLAGDVPVTQIISRADGTTFTREAGVAQYHKTHMHYHHTGFGTLELFKVNGANRLEKVGEGPKQGFCTGDVVAYQWTRFAGVQGEVDSQCQRDRWGSTFAPTGTAMGLTPGWADVYLWSQSGNYVEFGDNGDGRYVVRSTADASGLIAESNEHDNTSYAYIEITGLSIKVLERGFGQSPWDRSKRIARDMLQPVLIDPAWTPPA